jgi:hypothetical protein
MCFSSTSEDVLTGRVAQSCPSPSKVWGVSSVTEHYGVSSLIKQRATYLHGASNIDMRPTERRFFPTSSGFDAINERLEEQRSGAGAGRPATRLECCQQRHITIKGSEILRCTGQRSRSLSAEQSLRQEANARIGRTRPPRRHEAPPKASWKSA